MSLQPHVSNKVRLNDLVAVPIDLVPRNQRLGFPLYVKVAGNAVLLRTEDDMLSGDRAERLKQKTSNVFVPHASFGRFLDGLEKKPTSETSLAASLRLRDLLSSLADGFSKSREHQVRTLKQIENFSVNLAELLVKNPDSAGSLIRKSTESDLYFTNHNLNVAIYSALIGIKIGLGLKAIEKIVQGAVLHNVGNIFVSSHLLFKRGPLDRDEWEQVQTHPVAGSQLLLGLGVDKDIVMMVLQHHERMDGKGYPFALGANRIHRFAKICSIADVFDALTSERPYRRAVSAASAISIMREMIGKFDTSILNALER